MSFDPTNEDVRKLHQEVNQIWQQRFLVTTLAVTVFGVMIGLSVPRTQPDAGSPVGAFPYVVSISLNLVLLSLVLLHASLKRYARFLTTYLLVSGISKWESDIEGYRKRYWYLGYTLPQTFVFVLLGAFATLYPKGYTWIYSQTGDSTLEWAAISVGLVYVGIAVFAAYSKKMNTEPDAEQRWKSLLGNNQ